MTFFSRPSLEDLQFKQLTGSTLTLSGQTRIVSTSGLTLANGSGSTIVITARNPVAGNIMTFDGTEIRLMPPNPSGSTGNSGNYFCDSPTTCTVGGMPAGTPIFGCAIDLILECILVPTVPPTVTAPSHSAFIVSPSTSIYEVGTSISICATSCFSRGCITPQYCGSCCFRSGLPYSYNNIDYGVAQTPILSSACCNCHALSAHTITNGNNTVSATVSYLSGDTPAYNSDGSVFAAALPSGTTSALSCNICGLYPYFYGTVASSGASAGVNRPTPTCALVIAGTKVVADSNSFVYINFNSTSDDYVWFATHISATTKTCWCINALNNGAIGGAVSAGGNLFPAPASVNPVTTACWAGQTYKVYVSNYQTAVNTIMQLC